MAFGESGGQHEATSCDTAGQSRSSSLISVGDARIEPEHIRVSVSKPGGVADMGLWDLMGGAPDPPRSYKAAA
jgi:hypothetical protein